MTENMQMAIEYRDLLLEILDLEGKVFGTGELPEQKTVVPIVEKKEEPSGVKANGGPRKKVDRGKVLALARAGWKNADIARDLECSEGIISKILREAREEGTL